MPGRSERWGMGGHIEGLHVMLGGDEPTGQAKRPRGSVIGHRPAAQGASFPSIRNRWLCLPWLWAVEACRLRRQTHYYNSRPA